MENKTSRKIGKAAEQAAPRPGRGETAVLAALLVVLVCVAYARVVRCDFVNFDDGLLVVDNPHVNQGLTGAGVVWAFTEAYRSNWVPLTWISHMVDCRLFGLAPWGHHLVNLLLHIANAVLFFLLVRRLTGRAWPSLLAAGLFGVHPIHVESVAWVAERKDVLSALFWLVSCHAYLRYARGPGFRRYLGVVVPFVLGLLAKPMLVTLPCVFLILDFWPLRRFASRPSPWMRLVVEKIPLFCISALFSAIAFFAQRGGGAVDTIDNIPIGMRFGNAAVSYVTYLGKLLFPSGLPVFQPHPRYAPGSAGVLNAILALALLTALAVAGIRRRPYLAAGWFWYLGTLVPVIGLVQVGAQGLAYRYTYIPLMGITIALAQAVSELADRGRIAASAAKGVTLLLLCLLAALTWRQTGRWRNTESLFRYTLGVTEGNYLAHNNLAARLIADERYEEAIRHIQQALELRPDYPDALSNLGLAYFKTGRFADGVEMYKRCLAVRPEQTGAALTVGTYYLERQRFGEATPFLEKALASSPGDDAIRFYLGYAYGNTGRPQEALEMLEGRELRLDDTRSAKRYLLAAAAHRQLGQYEKAAATLREGLGRFPDSAEMLEHLAYLEYSHLNEMAGACAHFKRLLELSPNHPKRDEYLKIINYLAPRVEKPADEATHPGGAK